MTTKPRAPNVVRAVLRGVIKNLYARSKADATEVHMYKGGKSADFMAGYAEARRHEQMWRAGMIEPHLRVLAQYLDGELDAAAILRQLGSLHRPGIDCEDEG